MFWLFFVFFSPEDMSFVFAGEQKARTVKPTEDRLLNKQSQSF